METLLLLVAQVGMGAQHDLQEARQVFFAELLGDAADAGAFVGGNLEQGSVCAADLNQHGVAQKAVHLTGNVRRVVSFGEQEQDAVQDGGLHACPSRAGTRDRLWTRW